MGQHYMNQDSFSHGAPEAPEAGEPVDVFAMITHHSLKAFEASEKAMASRAAFEREALELMRRQTVAFEAMAAAGPELADRIVKTLRERLG